MDHLAIYVSFARYLNIHNSCIYDFYLAIDVVLASIYFISLAHIFRERCFISFTLPMYPGYVSLG